MPEITEYPLCRLFQNIKNFTRDRLKCCVNKHNILSESHKGFRKMKWPETTVRLSQKVFKRPWTNVYKR